VARNISLVAAFALVALGSPEAVAAADAGLSFESTRASFGDTYQFQVVEARFTAVNRGARPLSVTGIEAVSLAGEARPSKTRLLPGERLAVAVRQPVGDKLGLTTFRFKVKTDDAATPEIRLALAGFVQSAYDPETLRLDLGTVDRARGATGEVTVATREAASLTLVGTDEAPSWLRVAAAENGDPAALRLAVTAAPGAPLGAHEVRLLLRTGLASQPQLQLRVAAAVFGDFVPSLHHLDLGLARRGSSVGRDVEIRSRSGQPVSITGVAGAPAGVTWRESACAGAPQDVSCRGLRVELAPTTVGHVTGTLLVALANQEEPLPISFAAMAVEADQVVKDITAALAAGARDEGLPPELLPPAAPREARASPPEPGPRATLEWQSADEREAYGYLVYRADSRAGPYVRIDREIVWVDRIGPEPHHYRYVDEQVEVGRTYYYYVDYVTKSGRKQRFSPVASKTIVPVQP
jgi:hypothetical protein